MSEDTNKKVRLYVFVGAYGSGKSEVSVHFAHMLKQEDPSAKVMLADLDIVNPYFRSSDYAEILKREKVKVVGPVFANTNTDTPSLPPEMGPVLADESKTVIVDVGGDDVGATALGRYADISVGIYGVVENGNSI